jgi:hypothetical protein
MPNNRVPIEAMRCGALPASDHQPSRPDEAFRAMIDEWPRRDPAVIGYLPLRTCRCGSQVWLGSPADADHQRLHGDRPGQGTETLPACQHCGELVAAGVRYCSARCAAKAIRARRPGDVAG